MTNIKHVKEEFSNVTITMNSTRGDCECDALELMMAEGFSRNTTLIEP